MKILFLHGWNSKPGGVKATYLIEQGHEVVQPQLPDDDFSEAVRIAQTAFNSIPPDCVVGSSRGGAVAMHLQSNQTPLVLLCPAWKKFGKAKTVKAGTKILHSQNDEIIPFEDSQELVRASGLPSSALIVTGNDHRLGDEESLQAMLTACLNT